MTESATVRESLGCDLAAEVLRRFGSVRLHITGASMLPVLWPGDVVSVSGRDTMQTQPGEVVVFQRDGRLVAHRVVGRTTRQGRLHWITRGDSAERDDAPVSHDDLLGRVCAIERGSERVTPHQSGMARLVAGVLRRSVLCTRLALHFRKQEWEIRSWRIA